MLIPPRLNRLLRLLLEHEEPVTVNALAERLGASRRTVFRELENTGVLLDPFGLRIATQAGAGIRLEGEPSGRAALAAELDRTGQDGPADKRERLYRLLLELLRSPEIRKLHTYAAHFKVSESTISHDLDEAEKWLSSYHLTLIRRPGLGVGPEGAEPDFRRALTCLLDQSSEGGQLDRLAGHGFLEAGALEEVCAILRGVHDPLLDQMTGASQARLAIYMAVAVERIAAGRALAEASEDGQSVSPLAARLSDALEKGFHIRVPPAERVILTVQIAGARRNCRDTGQDAPAPDQFELQRLACRMIDRFDPDQAWALKLDETLLRGLAFHLKSAVVRLQHGVELQDPMLGQVAERYPDVFRRSREAAQVLWEEYSQPVSESEAGFLAMHFGAAVMRLEERNTHKRTVHVGVLCVNGIGASYMMASQIKARFKNDVEVTVCVLADILEQPACDFYVSAIPQEISGAVVLTAPALLKDADLERIEAEISRRAYRSGNAAVPEPGGSLASDTLRMVAILKGIHALLDGFQAVAVEAGSTFEDLAKLAGYQWGNSPENGRLIYESLTHREEIATQVLPDLGLALLHARTAGVGRPVLALFRPKDAYFSDPYLQGAMAAVIMLIPATSDGDLGRLMGTVSSALVEDTRFLEAIRSGAPGQARGKLESILRAFALEQAQLILG